MRAYVAERALDVLQRGREPVRGGEAVLDVVHDVATRGEVPVRRRREIALVAGGPRATVNHDDPRMRTGERRGVAIEAGGGALDGCGKDVAPVPPLGPVGGGVR